MPEVYDASRPAPEVQGPAAGADKAEFVPHQLVEAVLRRCGEVRRRAAGGAYWVLPQKKFVSMQQDEEIALLLRAHPITNAGWIFLVGVMLILPTILEATGMFAQVPVRFVWVGKLAWYLLAAGMAFEKWLYWYYTVVIVTNERVIDIDFVNLLHRVVSYATLNHIEEPSMVAGGLVRSILHFGDVHIATAANQPSVEAHAVPYPDRVVRIISELAEELEKRRERGE